MNMTDRKILKKFKSLLSKKIKVKRLILFGSRARGDSEPDSDMDLLVVVDNKNTEIENYISDCAWEAGIDQGILISPITLSAKEWGKSPLKYSLLAKTIQHEGITI